MATISAEEIKTIEEIVAGSFSKERAIELIEAMLDKAYLVGVEAGEDAGYDCGYNRGYDAAEMANSQ